ncbi:MAG: hypothetical protein ACJ772_07850 [Gemmatimonadaceae bacterium]
MMWRLFLVLCVGSLVSFGTVRVSTAQTTSYDDNALRLEGHRGDTRIVRGVDGTVLGRIGVFHGVDVAKIVGPSKKATFEAKNFAANYGPGTWITAVGLATLGAAVGVSRIHDVNRSIPTGLTVGGGALLIYGGGRLERAYNALSRSIWWYNRDLAR